MIRRFLAWVLIAAPLAAGPTWHADNGDGTYSNPLFYDEFSDPDMIRVGGEFYLTGTTMHTMPGLPVLRSRDLVNWTFVSYACEGLNLGPEYRLEEGESAYGQGIWAPSFRHRDGTFYIFANVNHKATQVFTARNPAGPWTHSQLKRSLHDLSVLFDDDGRTYVVWGYRDIHLARLDDRMEDLVPGSEKVIIRAPDGMGEGSHFYKIGGKYFITSAWWAGRMRMVCARADRPEGPYEVNQAISKDEDFGIPQGWRLAEGARPGAFKLTAPLDRDEGRTSLHQGGLVQTPGGQWWGFSMMDANSVGRLTCLSPVTWKEGWPYFGLPGNLRRTPRTWFKPEAGSPEPVHSPYERSDSFAGPDLGNVWQWNHWPVQGKWSLAERPGYLRLHALKATDFWTARDTLTQRAIGPESAASVELDASGLAPGDLAGIALLNYPYAWVGARRTEQGYELVQFDQSTQGQSRAVLNSPRVRLQVACDFLSEKARFGWAKADAPFASFGGECRLVFQLTTFQGVRFALFSYSTADGLEGGYADFRRFQVEEPHPTALTKPIPTGHIIRMRNLADGRLVAVKEGKLVSAIPTDPIAATTAAGFRVLAGPSGCVSLLSEADGRALTVEGLGESAKVSLQGYQEGARSQRFLWTEMPRGELALLSLESQRYLRIGTDGIGADAPGVSSDRSTGASLAWEGLP